MTRIKTEAKRMAILSAAEAEFSQRGFHETTLEHIARRMGSSKATIYNYFQTKEELLGSVLAKAAVPVTTGFLAIFDRGLPIFEALILFGRAYLRLQTCAEVIALQRLLIAEHSKAPAAILPLRSNPEAQLWPRIAEILSEEQAKGTVRSGDTLEMARHLRSLLTGELPPRLMFGDRTAFSEEELNASVDSAIRFFAAACAC
jgi:TetR/AcrR family transcriptional regulator, mexJK operon transcriptional repressor